MDVRELINNLIRIKNMETNNGMEYLQRELQEYYDNAAKGGNDRHRNIILLRWDIRKLGANTNNK